MPKFSVEVTYKFEGVFYIDASSAAEAEEFAEKHCGLVLGGNIHSSLPDDMVDWDFLAHPDKQIGDAQPE